MAPADSEKIKTASKLNKIYSYRLITFEQGKTIQPIKNIYIIKNASS